MKTYIYMHICCINNYDDIVKNLINKIKHSGLYDIIDEIRCCILGNYNGLSCLANDPKLVIHNTHNDVGLYEVFTINTLLEDSKKEEFNVLYIHSKGIRHNNTSIPVNDWIKYLCYFNILQYKTCIELLKTNDTVGVNLQDEPCLHYSGNFWWATSSYLSKLDTCTNTHYNDPEFWLTRNKNGNYISLWNSGVNHYCSRYDEDIYANKPIEIIQRYYRLT